MLRIMPGRRGSKIPLERVIAAISDQRHEKASVLEVVNRERKTAGLKALEAKAASGVFQAWIARVNRLLERGDPDAVRLATEEEITVDGPAPRRRK